MEICKNRIKVRLSILINRLLYLFSRLQGKYLLTIKLQVLIITFCLILHPDHLSSQDYTYRNFGISDGLAQPYVYTITQDNRGNLWAGTGDGLSSYNGFVFTSFTTSDSLPDNYISSSYCDGTVTWFGHRNGKISCFDGKVFRQVESPSQDLSPVTHFATSPDSRLWISTLNNGLYVLNRKKMVLEGPFLRDCQSIVSFEFITADELLVAAGTSLKRIRIGVSGEVLLSAAINGIDDSRVVSIRKKREGESFYAATQDNGIYNISFSEHVPVVSKITTTPSFIFTGVQDILEDSQFNIWIGTFGHGLLKIVPDRNNGEGNRLYIYDKSAGFPATNVKTLFEDREGVIWSGNYGEGLTEITPGIFTFKTVGNARSLRSIFSVLPEGNSLWLGTDEGLEQSDILTGKVISSYGKGSGLPGDTITSLYAGKAGEIYAGTWRNGVFRILLKNGRISKIPLGNGDLENSVTAITGEDDQLWIGTKKGLCNIHIKSGETKWFSINAGGLPHNYINGLFADRHNRIWVTTNSNTLTVIKDGKVSKMTINPGKGNLILGSVTEDSDSRIWLGSKGRGVFVIQSDSVINISSRQGLFSDYCYSIVHADNYIWVVHRGGISRIRPTDFSVRTFNNFGENRFDAQFNINSVGVDSHQKIWFGSDKGLIVYDPSGNMLKPLPPVLSISTVSVNDIKKEFTGNRLTLPPGRYRIRFDFIGVSMIDPCQVSYQYMLKGYDHWSEITRSGSVSYNNVTSGEYTFILKASGAEGAVSKDPLIFNITIDQPLWRKWWFYPAAISVLILVVCLYIKWRLISLIKEKRVLENKVLRRTEEIQLQKDEIEFQNNLINNINACTTSSITYASYLQKAVMPPVDLIDKLIPDNFILNRPKDIVSGDFYWFTGKDDKIILVVGDCTGHGVPGAFMSVLGIASLNEIVNLQGLTRSDLVVSALRERVIYSLHQNGNDITRTDGMEIAICVIDPMAKSIQFTGAKIDLVYFSDGKMEIFRADHFDVSASSQEMLNFTMQEFFYKPGDVIYLSSDGYQDQFGGKWDKKLMRPYFLNLLYNVHKLTMNRQKDMLENSLSEWMRDCPQTDDITIFGCSL